MRTTLIASGIATLLSLAMHSAFAEASAEDRPAPAKEPAVAKAAPTAAKDAAVEWRPCDVRDVNADVKKALIAACDKLAGDDEVKGFTYYQTSTDAKVPLFKAEFTAGDKTCVVICTPSGEITSSEAKANPK